MKLKKEWIIYIGIAIVTVLLNVLAWNSTAFCDAYIAYVFPIWVNTYGRLTGLFSFSVGEWLIVAGIVLVAMAVLLGVLAILLKVVGVCKQYFVRDKKTLEDSQVRESYQFSKISLKKVITAYYRFFAWTLLIVCVIMTLNCSILYHASTFSQKYFGDNTKESTKVDSSEYTIADVIRLYNYVAEQCNELCQKVERAEDGTILYHGVNQQGEPVDMEDKAIEVMQQLGKTYGQLDGYYPRPKPMMFSDFMCQQYMCGYYFPFSMEANYNDVMYIMNKPASMCHELAHLRGYIYEDEANFISYLACVSSDDVIFQYAGYLSVVNYLINDLNKAIQTSPEAYKKALEEVQPISMYAIVQEDNIFVTEEEWERINGKALIDTETVDEISDTFTDTTLKLNGVSDGMVSYSRVVKLLLQYYDYNSAVQE